MQVHSGGHLPSALGQTTERGAQNQKQRPDTGRVTIVPAQSPRKRLAMEAPDQISLNKRTKYTAQSNRTRKLTFSEDTKKHDGKVNYDSPLQRMIDLGLHTIKYRNLKLACEERLSTYSDPRDLLLLSLFAQDKKADSELIDRIKTKLAITLRSGLLMYAPPPWELDPPCSDDDEPPYSYDDIVRLHQSLASHKSNSSQQHTLDKADDKCLKVLREAIFERVETGVLSNIMKLRPHQYRSVSKVIELYTAYRDEGLKNGTDFLGTELASVDGMLGELVMMIPKDLLVLQYLIEIEEKYKNLEG